MARANSSNNKPKTGVVEFLRGIASRGKELYPTQKHALEQRLADEKQLFGQLANKEAEAHELSQQLAQLHIKQKYARDAVEGLSAVMSTEESGRLGIRDSGSKYRLDTAQVELSSAIADIEELEARLQTARDEIEGLRHQIQSISRGATVDEVKAYLSALDTQCAQVMHLEELIRNVEADPVQDDPGNEELAALQQAREELLADIAAGTAKREDLEALDAQADEFLNEISNRQTEGRGAVLDHQQTLAGLTRRLTVAQERQAELVGQTHKVIEQLLTARAAGIYKKYMSTAEVLMTLFHQLQGLQELLTASAPNSKVRILSPNWPGLLIPSAGKAVVPSQSSEYLYTGKEACQLDALREDHQQALAELTRDGLAGLFEKISNS